jgi:hypothetical protein
MTTEEIHASILASSVFRTGGPPIDLCASLIALADAIKAEPETDWNIGEYTEACLSDLVVGAYWALSEWHAGQWSDSYAALCALGGIYSPNMERAPDEDDSAFSAYSMINEYFAVDNASK